MRFPVVCGIIDRRILANYRVSPPVIAQILPPPFRPQLVHGYGIAGICLIRLKRICPKASPFAWGIKSENAAHRVAVEWDDENGVQRGVFIFRRDTSSRLNAWLGGRLFPGEHQHARFVVDETPGRLSVAVHSDDSCVQLAVRGHPAACLPPTSVFNSLREASEFFEKGCVGYSATSNAGRFEGLELKCKRWDATALQVDEIRSSFFDDRSNFPPGSIEFDGALLMRGIEHEWHARGDLCGVAAV